MASGAQGRADGLAKAFADYVRTSGFTHDEVAKGIGMSKTYTTKRINGEGQFTVKDFEHFAKMVDLDPQELLARVRLPDAAAYRGRLIPTYEVVATSTGKTVYLLDPAEPQERPANVISGRFGVGAPGEDEPSVKQPPAKHRTAARKGTTKADEAPHAD